MSADQSMYDNAYFERDILENQYLWRGELRPDQEAALEYLKWRRQLGRILSIGCGRGFLEAYLAAMGAEVTAIECRDNTKFDGFRLILGGMDAIPKEDFDQVIFVESLEHIEPAEFERNWPRLRDTLARTHGRLIVVNWEHHHPLIADGYDHIQTIDDAFYDRLSSQAERVIHRKGSHLVLDF